MQTSDKGKNNTDPVLSTEKKEKISNLDQMPISEVDLRDVVAYSADHDAEVRSLAWNWIKNNLIYFSEQTLINLINDSYPYISIRALKIAELKKFLDKKDWLHKAFESKGPLKKKMLFESLIIADVVWYPASLFFISKDFISANAGRLLRGEDRSKFIKQEILGLATISEDDPFGLPRQLTPRSQRLQLLFYLTTPGGQFSISAKRFLASCMHTLETSDLHVLIEPLMDITFNNWKDKTRDLFFKSWADLAHDLSDSKASKIMAAVLKRLNEVKDESALTTYLEHRILNGMCHSWCFADKEAVVQLIELAHKVVGKNKQQPEGTQPMDGGKNKQQPEGTQSMHYINYLMTTAFLDEQTTNELIKLLEAGRKDDAMLTALRLKGPSIMEGRVD